MKKLKIYLDTSIISFAIDGRNPREKRLTLRLIDEIKAGKYEAFISAVTIAEIKRADNDICKKLLEVVSVINPEELAVDEEAQALANRYITEGIIPVKYADDALHIAVASVNDLDLIISWNFEHIVKFKTKREVTGINSLTGYKNNIEIYSPLEVVQDE
jgi:predicted nucleic acid-binding protein